MSFNGAGYLKPSVEYFVEVGREGPTNRRVVDVVVPIGKWIQEQDADQWVLCQGKAISFIMDRYIVSDEIYTLLVLKWS